MSQMIHPVPASRKRKRLSADQDTNELKRASLSDTNGNGEHLNGSNESYSDSSANEFSAQLHATANDEDISSTAAAALTAHLAAPENQNLSFVSTGSGADERQLDDAFTVGDALRAHDQASAYVLTPYGSSEQLQSGRESNGTSQKPAVGTDEWHKVRRDNHKEVERRRRETINEGINELAKIVPGCEKNKGSILARAVEYINELKARDDQAGEKKTLEKVVLEQAVSELMTRNDEMRAELQRVADDNRRLRLRLGESGVGGVGGGGGSGLDDDDDDDGGNGETEVR